jgi:glycosyltransferase involved in cell wall biosynthesis
VTRAIVLVAGRDPLAEIGGGHSPYVRAHARAAAALGFTPHLFCIGRQGGVVETEFGVLHRIASPFRPYRQIMICGHGPLLASGVFGFLRREQQPVLVHSFGVWGYVGVVAGRRLRKHGGRAVPIVNSYTTYEAEARSNRQRDANRRSPIGNRMRYWAEHLWVRMIVERYERIGYLGSALVLFNYESVRRLLLAKYDVAARCRKLPYTSESAFLGAAASRLPDVPDPVARLQPREAPLLVAVSRHNQRKGVHVLIRALGRLRSAGVPFRACLIGDGPLLREHRQLAATLGLQGSAVLTGRVPDPSPYLRCAAAFVLPSLGEQSGSVALIEAMQAGLPVVASGCDGILEDVADGDSGLLVPPGDEVALSEAIGRVLQDRALRAALGARARQVFTEKFSAAGLVRALGETYAVLGFSA